MLRLGKTNCALIVLGLSALLGAGEAAFAQISPGPLACAHESLEGLTNCTRCHTLGKEISNSKCLECHKEIQSRVAANTGYHATVQQHECVECHKDHFGKTFALVRLDTKSFDHSTTGYRLVGKHRELECQQCHKKDLIRAGDILHNAAVLSSNTYLGLGTACFSCHVDVHQGQLPNTCEKCHTSDAWSPAPKFDHNTARYVLTGKHLTVQCNSCHRRVLDGGKTIQFARMEFATCSTCHGDPHRGKFKQTCESCHTTQGWNMGVAKAFDHRATQFPLLGKHATVPCAKCHGAARGTATPVSADRFHIARFRHCADCHADPHRGEFARRKDGGACESCHTENGFSPSKFEHSTARFALVGKHADVKCATCHEPTPTTQGRRELVDFSVAKFAHCADCHADEHLGQFANIAGGGACETCHSENGYSPSTFGIERHQKTDFGLAGAHAAVACVQCHQMETIRGKRTREYQWKERVTCQKCHRDVHLGEVDRVMTNGCATCHSVERWMEVKFAGHDSTKFPLTGKHAGVACDKCHKLVEVGSPGEHRQFKGVPTRCVDCHGDKMQESKV